MRKVILLFYWVVANIISVNFIWHLGFNLLSYRLIWDTGYLGTTILGAAVGLTQGLAQWLVLRRYIRKAGTWILATGIGYAIACLIVGVQVVVMHPHPALSKALLLGTPIGEFIAWTVIGVAQWIVLKYLSAWSFLWIIAFVLSSFISRVTAIFFVMSLNIEYKWPWETALIAGRSLSAFLFAIITGFLLSHLLSLNKRSMA